MNKTIVFVFCGCLFFLGSFAQTTSVRELLHEIENNNTELKAYQSFIESRQLENRSRNNLPDPQFSAYYLPYGSNNTVDYTEIQISQSLEFPTVYNARDKWNKLKYQQLESDYAIIRQGVLLQAQNLLIELVFLQKQKDIEVLRIEKSKQVFDQIQELFNKEQIGVLDLNKAKISWMQKQFMIEQFDSEIQITFASLEKLNGGKSIDFDNQSLESKVEIESLETIWKIKLTEDPTLKLLRESEATSLQKIQLERNKVLPNLTAGYNYQGVSGNNISGFFGGISIPIWSSKNKVKAAKANYQYRQSNTEVVTENLYLAFQKQYNRFQLLLKKYKEYKTTIATLNSEKLLFKAFMLGEFSFMKYHVELQFYRQAYDKMLQMERELNQLKAKLLKHQL
jgi:outer membrane protein TolC